MKKLMSLFVLCVCATQATPTFVSLSPDAKQVADTLKPTVIFTDTRPKPRVYDIPKAGEKGKSYTYTDAKGKTVTIPLSPPEVKALPVLCNKKGEPIKPRPALRHWIDTTMHGDAIRRDAMHGVSTKKIIKTDSVQTGLKPVSAFIQGEAGGYTQMQNYNTEQGLALSSITQGACVDRFGNLWFGTSGGGVSRYDGKTFTNYTSAQGLANNKVWSIVEDQRGNLWFGTDGGGVSRYDGKTFTNYTSAPHFQDGVIYAMVQDKMGTLFLGSNSGFGGLYFKTPNLRLFSDNNKNIPDFLKNKKEGKKFPADNPLTNEELVLCKPVWDIYNNSTGYPVKDVNSGHNTMYCDSKGIIWIATGDDRTALVRFDPSAVQRNPKPPQAVIQSVKIDEEKICWYSLGSEKVKGKSEKVKVKISADSAVKFLDPDSIALTQQEIITYGKILTETERQNLRQKFAGIEFDGITRFYPLPKNLVLPYEHNNITIEFAAIEPAKPYLIKYQYLLEGYQKDWSPVTSNTSATFGNMDAGNYTFKLKVLNPDALREADGWSEPITYSFTVQPPFYKAWWFFTMEVGAAAVFFGLIFLYKKKRVRFSIGLTRFTVSSITFVVFEYLQNFAESSFGGNVVFAGIAKIALNIILGLTYRSIEQSAFTLTGLKREKDYSERMRLMGNAMEKDVHEVELSVKKQFVLNMLVENLSYELISKCSGLKIQEVEMMARGKS